jgi:cytochrome oxidase Cu insertion factor (SCO1/SenC/PrrC family)
VKRTLLALCAGVGLLLAALPIAYLTWPAPKPAVIGDADIGGAFELIDARGNTVDEKTFADQWTLVFFGFTHCPDVCPTTLVTIADVLKGLGSEAAAVQPLFVTLDPERDTPEVMGTYTAYFDKRIVGLTGSEEQVRQMSDAYAVYARKAPAGDSYTIDHTTAIYLMKPDGTFAQAFVQESAETMTQQIRQQLNAY